MTNLIKHNYPTLFRPDIFDGVFSQFEDYFGKSNTTVPYDVERIVDKNDQPVATKISVALAGYSKDNINVKCVNDELHINVDKIDKVDKSNKNTNSTVIHKGIASRSFSLKFKLLGIDKKGIKSSYNNGMLEVTLPDLSEDVTTIEID